MSHCSERLAHGHGPCPEAAAPPRPPSGRGPVRRRVHTSRTARLCTTAAAQVLQQPLEADSLLSLSRYAERRAAKGAPAEERAALLARRDCQAGQVLLSVPEGLVATSADVATHRAIGPLAEGRSELVGLALLLLAELAEGPSSKWRALVESLPLPGGTQSPLLWTASERKQLLRGSPVLPVAESRRASLEQEWEELAAAASQQGGPAAAFTREGFLAAMSAVFAHVTYLPAASCFALVPQACLLRRSGEEAAAVLDYDPETQSVQVTAQQPYRAGEEVTLYDGRPNSEMILAQGAVEEANPGDCLAIEVGLVRGDRLYEAKREVLAAFQLGPVQAFPVYADRMPLQLLAYLRLARLQDPALLAKVSFEGDVILSTANEYEVLQLLLGECRTRLAAYAGTAEEDLKTLQRWQAGDGVGPREALAARLLRGEKLILQGTLDAVRRRLAPIRGIPTKAGGMRDANADLMEIFDTIEAIPKAPGTLLGGFMKWARGEDDPDFRKPRKGGGKAAPPKRPW